jgi:hypothetical protein
MPKTETELATEVLDHLGVIGAGQSAEAADVDRVIDAYRNKYAELDGAGLEYTYWDRGEIPEAIFFIVRDLVALEVGGMFGQPIAASQKDVEETIILKRLRRHSGTVSTGLPVYSEYF